MISLRKNKRNFGKTFQKTKKTGRILWRKTTYIVRKWPLGSFLAVLALLLALIVLSNIFQKPRIEENREVPPTKVVSVYRVGSVPKLTLQAQIEKSGVIQIVSLTSGVIQKINVREGAVVGKGDTLLSLATNYQGGNALTTQRQIAETQYQTAALTYEKQKEIIKRQKEQAEKTDENSDELRKITGQSIQETQDAITLNESILSTLDQQLTLATNSAAALPIQQQKTQLLAATNQQKQALRNAQYQASGDNPPAELSNLQKEITIRQLELQEKTLLLSKQIAGLQAQLARINEQLMFPATPFNGTIQRVFVKEGQAVNPGTPLFILSQTIEDDPVTAIVYVSHEVAQKVSYLEPSILHIGNSSYEVYPSFISQEAVQGSLYAIYYPIPDTFNSALTDKGFISVEIPIGYADTTIAATYIPLDSVYQTRDSSYVFIAKGNQVESRTVKLGQVYGSSVEVLSGLKDGDSVILNRDIIQGDNIQVQ